MNTIDTEKDADREWRAYCAIRSAAAFNEGSNARLAGRPRTDNPYSASHDSTERRERDNWTRGWNDVDVNWGRDAKGRWVAPLPVMGATAVEVSGGAAT